MLKATVSLLLFLLMMITAGEDNCASTETGTPVFHTSSCSYHPTQSPSQKTMDFILNNRFADVSCTLFTADTSDQSLKSRCVLRLLAALCECGTPELQTNHIDYHLHSSLYPHAVDYYIYALRRIII